MQVIPNVNINFNLNINAEMGDVKASSRGLLTPWRRVCTERERTDIAQTTTPPLDDDDREKDGNRDGDLYPLALWNACAISPISPIADAEMCHHGMPWKRVDRVEDGDEESRSAGEESLWTPGKRFGSFVVLVPILKRALSRCLPLEMSLEMLLMKTPLKVTSLLHSSMLRDPRTIYYINYNIWRTGSEEMRK
jgi:hypothetical protein